MEFFLAILFKNSCNQVTYTGTRLLFLIHTIMYTREYTHGSTWFVFLKCVRIFHDLISCYWAKVEHRFKPTSFNFHTKLPSIFRACSVFKHSISKNIFKDIVTTCSIKLCRQSHKTKYYLYLLTLQWKFLLKCKYLPWLIFCEQKLDFLSLSLFLRIRAIIIYTRLDFTCIW